MAFSFRDYAESDEVKRRRQQAEQHSTYNEEQSVINARNALQQHEQNRVSPWTGGTYGDALKQAVDRINNREKFTYDLNGDMLYQQYKDQYMRQGRLAMQDTMGQAAALTGGYGNSYAATAGNQAYQSYLTQLNDVIPQLYQLALDKYDREGQDMYNRASLLGSMYGTEYGEYRDRVGDWNTEAARLGDRYNSERNFDYGRFSDDRNYYTGRYDTERQWDYGLYSDDYSRGFANYQQGVSESQFAQQMALQQAELAERIRANKADEAYKMASLAARNSGGSGRSGSGGSGGSSSAGASGSGSGIASRSGQAPSLDSVLSYIAEQRRNGNSDAAIGAALRAAGIDDSIMKQTNFYNMRIPY